MRESKPQSTQKWFLQLAITVLGFAFASFALAHHTPAGFFTSVVLTIGLVALLPDEPEEPRLLQRTACLSEQQEACQELASR